jgi:hypothetical protein
MRAPFGRALLAVLALTPPARADEIPPGWFKAGYHGEQFVVGVDPKVRHQGEASAFIQAETPAVDGFGTLVQTVDAAPYRGGRLRFSAYVKSESVARWAGLWVRVDGRPQGERYPKALAFDNMHDRPIQGTKDWTRYEIVVDVRRDAHSISYAVQLSGGGRVWIDDVTVEAVTAADAAVRPRATSQRVVEKK